MDDYKWYALPGNGTTDAAPSGVAMDHVHLFAKGIRDKSVNVNEAADPENLAGGWTGWIEVGPAGGVRFTTEVAPCAAAFGKTLFLFAQGTEARLGTVRGIFLNKTNDGQNWTGWVELPGGGTTDAALAAAALGNVLFVFSKGIRDHWAYLNTTADGVHWAGWAEVPGHLVGMHLTTDVAMSAATASFDAGNTNLYVFAQGANGGQGGTPNGLFVNSTADGMNWSGWAEVPGQRTSRISPHAAAFLDHLQLYVVRPDNKQIEVATLDRNGWSAWGAIGETNAMNQPGTTDAALSSAVLPGAPNALYLFGKGIDDRSINIASEHVIR